MGKRFTETTKWTDPWFRKLTPPMKCLWQYLCDCCDAAGVIDFDEEMATLQIGYSVGVNDFKNFGDRVSVLPSGKWRVVKFLDFQYGSVDAKCPAHKPVIRLIQLHGIEYPINNLSNKVLDRAKETEQDKDKDKDKDKDQSGEVQRGVESEPEAGLARSAEFNPPTVAEAVAYAATSAPVPISEPCVMAWHDDRLRARWHYQKAGKLFPLEGDWRPDLRSFARNWNSIEHERKSKNGIPQSTRKDSGNLNPSGRYGTPSNR
jgi:hypothetical protein